MKIKVKRYPGKLLNLIEEISKRKVTLQTLTLQIIFSQ